MKKFINKATISLAAKTAAVREKIRLTTEDSAIPLIRTREILAGNKGEGFVDTAVKILIAVVIGALLLAGLYLLFSSTILPELTRRIQDMFNYRG